MFTGIVTARGEVISVKVQTGLQLQVRTTGYADIMLGESIAVNGVCLTVAAYTDDSVYFDISTETLARTVLGALQVGDSVHLERSLRLGDRMGGHWVYGHVDQTVSVLARSEMQGSVQLCIGPFAYPEQAYLIPKGSIAVDGVSLTINSIRSGEQENMVGVEIMLIPTTCAHTHLSALSVGDKVHIEFDQLAKMVHHQLRIGGSIENGH